MSKQIRLRRGTTAETEVFTGAEGELTYDSDLKGCDSRWINEGWT